MVHVQSQQSRTLTRHPEDVTDEGHRRRPPTKLAVGMLILGVLLAVPLVVKFVSSVGASVTADSHRTPVELTEQLVEGRYVVFERTGTTRQAGPITHTEAEPPSLSIESVHVRDPSGNVVPVHFDRANETITQGNAIYTGVLVFDAGEPGRYTISVGGEGRQVLISRSIGQAFRDLALPFGIAALGGLVFLTGAVLLLVALVRGKNDTPRVNPGGRAVLAGWYPNPEGNGQRYWDGRAWTEHRAP